MKMANAIKVVRSEKMGLKKTSKVYEVPRSTLRDEVNSVERAAEKLINKPLVRKAVLPFNLEEELISYCLMRERKFFGLTTRSVKLMAFELAIKWSCPSVFGTTRNRRLEVAV
jgi:hypothetical protein